jgi:hypothetical protein
MEYGAKYAEIVAWCRTRSALARHWLTRALATFSTKLSVVTVLGIGAISVQPQDAASTLRAFKLPARPPIEIVRPKQVIIDGAEEGDVELVASRRQRRRAAEPQPPAPVRKDSAIAVEPEPPPPEPPAAAPVEPPRPDVWSDAELIAALRDCVKLLAPISAEVELAPPIKQEQCGAAAPVLLRRLASGSNRVEIQPPAMINCAMVAHLHEWVARVVQPAAEATFASPIVRLANASGYSCRHRNGSQVHSERLSEHALANAIDISGFVTADGRTIEVARHWGATLREEREAALRAREAKQPAAPSDAKPAAPMRTQSAIAPQGSDGRQLAEDRSGSLEGEQLQRLGRGGEGKRAAKAAPAEPRQEAQVTAEGMFLRRLHKGACGIFGTVLGPEANAAHRDHFHLDLAPRRRSAFCE